MDYPQYENHGPGQECLKLWEPGTETTVKKKSSVHQCGLQPLQVIAGSLV